MFLSRSMPTKLVVGKVMELLGGGDEGSNLPGGTLLHFLFNNFILHFRDFQQLS